MIWWHPELQNSVFQFRWDFKLSPVLVGVLASSMMRERERENITGFVFFGSRRILQAGGFQSFESLFGVYLLLFCSSCLEKETLFLLLQLEKHHPETKNCILIAATKVTPPRDQKKNCIIVAANSRNTTQRPKKNLHPCCCKLMKHHPETKTAFLLLQLKKHHPETYRKLLKVVHVNKKFHAPLERETSKNITKWTGATVTSSQYRSNGLASSTHSSEHWYCKNFPASATLIPCLCRLCRSLPESPLYPIFGGKQAHSSSRIWFVPWFHRLIIPSVTPSNYANNTHDSNQARWESVGFTN